VGGRAVSAMYNLVAGSREYNLLLGFDPNFQTRNLSLGKLHIGFAIENTIFKNLTEFDLLAEAGKNEYYKSALTDRTWLQTVSSTVNVTV
jgi:CelD/BcsL family acetyltransferase involved in cellulose biosynthesis